MATGVSRRQGLCNPALLAGLWNPVHTPCVCSKNEPPLFRDYFLYFVTAVAAPMHFVCEYGCTDGEFLACVRFWVCEHFAAA